MVFSYKEMDNKIFKDCKTERQVDGLIIRFEKELENDGREVVSRHWSDAQRTLFKACLLYKIERHDELTWETLTRFIGTYPVIRCSEKDNELNDMFTKYKGKCQSKKIESKACMCYDVFMSYPYKVRYTAAVCLISALEEYFGL